MITFKKIGILSAALLVSSCALMQPRLPEIQTPPDRIVQKGYSFMPLNEKGWLITTRNPYQLALAKRGTNPDETFAIQAIPFRLPTFATQEEFAGIIKEGQAKDTDTQRFKMLKHDVTNYLMSGTDCVKTHATSEDKAAVKRSGKSGYMLLEMLTLVCAHPNNKSVGISISYSHRYYPGQSDPEFVNKATSVLNSVGFSAL